MADKIPNFSEVSEDICWQDPKFQLEYPVLKTLWSRPSLSIDIVTSIFMSILRRSTPNSSHETLVLVAVDYPIMHCYSGITWLVTYYDDFCQLNLLKNSEIHWFQFIMNSSSHHTAMNYGSWSALFSWNGHNLAKNHPNFASWGCFGILKTSSWWWAQRFLKLMHPGLRNWRKRESHSLWIQVYSMSLILL